jgi:predicted nucleic acid-binding protein
MTIVDTGAMLALLDAGEDHHRAVKELYEEGPAGWLLPWAIFPELNYLVTAHLGAKAHETLLADLAAGAFSVEWGRDEDLDAARRICARHRWLRLGLVDAVVIATAERPKAEAIATLDLRNFSAVSIKGNPRLLPRDRGAAGR